MSTVPDTTIPAPVTPDPALVGQTVSAEHDGRTLEGVGVPEADLKATIEARSPDPTEKPDRPDRPSRGQKRFSELTSERDQAVARAEKAERDLAAAKASPAAPAAEPKPSETPAPVAAKPAERPKKPILDDFTVSHPDDPWSAYQEALTDWKVHDALSQLHLDARIDERLEAERATRLLADTVRDITARGRQEYDDFEAVLGRINDVIFRPDQYRAILALPESHRVQYALGQAPDLARKLSQASGVEFGLLLGQLSQTAGAASPASTPRPVPTTTAPAPVQPVGAGSRTAIPSLEELAASGNFEAYKAHRYPAKSA